MMEVNNFFILLKKSFATAFFCFGLFCAPQIKAATYTHSLTYRQLDGPGDTLTARVKFDDSNIPQQNVAEAPFNSDFIKDITFVYTPSGQASLTITYADFTEGHAKDKYAFEANTPGQVDFSDTSENGLYNQLSNLQFGQFGGEFALTLNAFANRVDASDGDTNTTDFLLEGSTYLTPAPLPLLGLVPAFKSISRLKKRYRSKKLT